MFIYIHIYIIFFSPHFLCVSLQASLTRSPPVKGEGQGEGLLFISYDRTLVVKQITSEDVADMHSILSEYHQVLSLPSLRESRTLPQGASQFLIHS